MRLGDQKKRTRGEECRASLKNGLEPIRRKMAKPMEGPRRRGFKEEGACTKEPSGPEGGEVKQNGRKSRRTVLPCSVATMIIS